MPARCEPTRGGSTVKIWVGPAGLAHPLFLLAVGLLLAVVPALTAGDDQIARWGQGWRFDRNAALAMLGLGGCIAIGVVAMCRIGLPDREVEVEPRLQTRLNLLANWLFAMVASGYLIWIGLAATRGFSVSELRSLLGGTPGATYRAREQFSTVPGLTTLTQFGPYLAAILALQWRMGTRRFLMIGAVLVLTATRVVGNSERLAIIEFALPVLLVLALTSSQRRRRPSRRKIVAPIAVAGIGVIGLFTLSESIRSWTSHYSTRFDGNILEFAFDRMWAYYATASNNGVLYYDFFPSGSLPLQSLQFVWNAPFLSDLLATSGIGPGLSEGQWPAILASSSNPEFNNPSSLLPLAAELGWPTAVFACLLWGLLLGWLFGRARLGSLAALCAYSVFAVSLLEVPRFLYLPTGRAVPLVIASLVGAWLLRVTKEPSSTPRKMDEREIHADRH